MAAELLDFYTAQDALTDPGAYAARLDDLPAGMDALHEALNGLLLHEWVVVDCRHFAVLLCAVLRHRGVPARPRCGFADHTAHGSQPFLVDHWVCEVWDTARRRWVIEDADLQLHDLSADELVTGARAWRLYRADPATAERCGDGPEARGPRIVRRNLVRDFASLNGSPSVSGDAWGLGRVSDVDVSGEDAALLDRAAALAECADDAALAAMRDLYASSPGLSPPDVIPHFDYLDTKRWRKVPWRDES